MSDAALPQPEAPTARPAAEIDGVQSATLYPNLTCNARCPFCSTRVYTDAGVISAEDYLRGDTSRTVAAYTRSLEECKQAYRDLRAAGVETVKLQGGEPTVYEHLEALLQYGAEVGFRQQIIASNGRAFKDLEYAARILRSGVSTVALSIYGARRETHDLSLGVAAFDDMVRGVRNLAEVRRGDPLAARVQLTGQLILHAHNFRELPEMLAFWHAQGLRYFAVRLLRESANMLGAQPNTTGGDWFFDLKDLGPYLERALDLSLELPDTRVVIAEVFYCALGEEYLGFVLGDLENNKRLHGPSAISNKHRQSVMNEVGDRRVSLQMLREACDACDFASACLKVEQAHQGAFTGTLRPWRVGAAVERAADGPRGSAGWFARARRLLACEEAMATMGIPHGVVSRLQGRLMREAESDEEFESVALSSRGRRRWADVVRGRMRAGAAVKFVKLSSLGTDRRMQGEGAALLAELRAGAASEAVAKQLDFLGRASCLAVDALFACWGGRAVGGGAFYVVVYNDFHASEAQAARLLAR